jgi:hypothetical protein
VNYSQERSGRYCALWSNRGLFVVRGLTFAGRVTIALPALPVKDIFKPDLTLVQVAGFDVERNIPNHFPLVRTNSSANVKGLLDQPTKLGLTLEKVVTVSSYRPRKKPRLWLEADGKVRLASTCAGSVVNQSREEPVS